jgi:hypothetical protein
MSGFIVFHPDLCHEDFHPHSNPDYRFAPRNSRTCKETTLVIDLNPIEAKRGPVHIELFF